MMDVIQVVGRGGGICKWEKREWISGRHAGRFQTSRLLGPVVIFFVIAVMSRGESGVGKPTTADAVRRAEPFVADP
jgi:hypothetical protein